MQNKTQITLKRSVITLSEQTQEAIYKIMQLITKNQNASDNYLMAHFTQLPELSALFGTNEATK